MRYIPRQGRGRNSRPMDDREFSVLDTFAPNDFDPQPAKPVANVTVLSREESAKMARAILASAF